MNLFRLRVMLFLLEHFIIFGLFSLQSLKKLSVILQMDELLKFFSLLLNWLKCISCKYQAYKLFELLFDIYTVSGIKLNLRREWMIWISLSVICTFTYLNIFAQQ